MGVVVVGSINRDVVARVPRIPGPGETLLGTGLTRGGGGKGANQVVAAARAGGVASAFVGAVGADDDGRALRAGLEADGVDVAGLDTVDRPTGVALISVADDGENAIVVVPGANHAAERLSDAQRALVTGADVVAAQLEIPVPLVLGAAAARRAGALFILNGAPSAPLTDPELAERMLAAVDVLVVNEHELRDVAGVAGVEEAVAALAPRVRALVVTQGAAGCIVAMGAERAAVPAFRAEAVDTTGAGDTFCGVLAARLGDAAELSVDALACATRAGAAAAALAVGRSGAQDAVPTAAEVEQLLATASPAA